MPRADSSNRLVPTLKTSSKTFQAFCDALKDLRVTMGPHIRSMAMAYRSRLDEVLDGNVQRQGLSLNPGL